MAVASKWVTPGTGTEWWTIPRQTSMVVWPHAVSLSVQWQTKLASQKACPGLRNVSLKRQMSTPCWLRKCSNSSFLLRTLSAFQQARHKALPRSVLLGRAAIINHKQYNGLQDCPQVGCPCGEGRNGHDQLTSQFHICLEGKEIEEIRDLHDHHAIAFVCL